VDEDERLAELLHTTVVLRMCQRLGVAWNCLSVESARLSLRPGLKLHAGMIGKPENDLRHIGHVGYDGVTFGDVSFIGDDYSKMQPLNSSSSRRQ